MEEKLAWFVVTRKPGDGIISRLQQCAEKAAALLKKKGPTGTGYLASKVPPNFIQVAMAVKNIGMSVLS